MVSWMRLVRRDARSRRWIKPLALSGNQIHSRDSGRERYGSRKVMQCRRMTHNGLEAEPGSGDGARTSRCLSK